MKRAPIIPKNPVKPSEIDDAKYTSPAPAAPMVDSLISRVGSLAKGNSINIPVCGRDVRFILELIPADLIENSTRVWVGNERDQDLLTEDSLDDIIPSFQLAGQQTPAFGRRDNGTIEIADGSRRRKASILTRSVYRVLVGELDDEQMATLSRLGNDYRPTSAYERGNRYKKRLENEFNGSISALADAEHISRKIITRCINTARLPKSVVALFSHPGQLSARAGDSLYKAFSNNMELLQKQVELLEDKKQFGFIFETDEIILFLTEVLKKPKSANLNSRHQYAPGITALYKGDKVVFSLDKSRVPNEILLGIEELLRSLEK